MRSILKNKKGFFPALSVGALTVIAVLVILLTAGILIFVSINKYAVIGGGAIALVLIFGLQGDMNKTKAWFMGIVIVGALVFLFASGVMETIGDYDVVYKQNWGHYCCVQYDDYDITEIRYMDDKTTRKCDDYTNECLFVINPDRDFNFLSGAKSFKYAICNIDGSSCSAWNTNTFYATVKKTDTKTITINAGKLIKFSDIFLQKDMKYFKVNKKVKSFYLKGQENGKVYVQESCILSSDLRRKTTTDGKNELAFDECQNYMIDFIKVATKTYLYNNKEVICQARQLYEIDEQQFKDGSTNKIQGEKLVSVNCCPSENNCDENTFDWIPDKIRECTYSSECSHGGDFYGKTGSSDIAEYFQCINNICVKKEKSVECTSTAVCLEKYGEGYVCDLSQKNYGHCIKSSVPLICGDGVCDIGETFSNCPEDCEEGERDLCPGWWEYETTSTEKDWKWYNYATAGLIKPKEITTPICKIKSWVIWAGFGVVVLFLGSLAIIVSKPKKRKRK
jgi:hypothetical protein